MNEQDVESDPRYVYIETDREVPANRVEEFIEANALPGDHVAVFDENEKLVEEFNYDE